VTFIKNHHYPSTESGVVLRQDGVAEVNLPDMWLDGFGRPSGKFHVGQARWRLVQNGSHWDVLLEFDGSTTFGQDPGKPWITWLNLTHQRPPYAIYVGIGDPDSGEGLEYVKAGGA
jgi:hypothetical protein